ncbi:MAG: 50S ribosomal protein L16 [Candidatus Nanoarchaeia archaeon]
MATLRKGVCYRKLTRPYTRKSKFKKHSFIAMIPPSKIVKYNFGDMKKQFKYAFSLVSKQDLNLRDNSLESIRQIINSNLVEKLGNDFNMIVKAYPHHILRENKMISGAGADRMQTGMSHSFGKPTGRAARINKGKAIVTVKVDENGIEIARIALKKAMPRLPGKYVIEMEKI